MINFKHYRFWFRDLAQSPDALLNKGEDFSVIRTWAFVDQPGSLEAVEEYCVYYKGHYGAHTVEDITEQYDEEFRNNCIEEQQNESSEQTQSSEQIPLKWRLQR